MCFCAWRMPAYPCHGDLTLSFTEDGWPGVDLGLVSRALGKAGFFLSHQISSPDLGTDFCLSCLTKELERLMTTDLCWLFGVYKALLQTLKVCNSDSDWITGSSLIQQWAERRQGRAGQGSLLVRARAGLNDWTFTQLSCSLSYVYSLPFWLKQAHSPLRFLRVLIWESGVDWKARRSL